MINRLERTVLEKELTKARELIFEGSQLFQKAKQFILETSFNDLPCEDELPQCFEDFIYYGDDWEKVLFWLDEITNKNSL